jgi:hypothetical protein
MQLTVDGSEVPFSVSRLVSRKTPLSHGQEEAVAFMRMHPCVNPTQIGVIVHANRLHGGCRLRGNARASERCCEYATSDGVEMLKRLMNRGLVEKISKGTYVLVGW